jgi:hypothetical protein
MPYSKDKYLLSKLRILAVKKIIFLLAKKTEIGYIYSLSCTAFWVKEIYSVKPVDKFWKKSADLGKNKENYKKPEYIVLIVAKSL